MDKYMQERERRQEMRVELVRLGLNRLLEEYLNGSSVEIDEVCDAAAVYKDEQATLTYYRKEREKSEAISEADKAC